MSVFITESTPATVAAIVVARGSADTAGGPTNG